ncbi:MAG: nucleoside-diphosphate sugar epimerase/dehydratase [Porphyromonas sp.]|nr:nucleoside-diphosphate sugar epimerase/dehydratase [Porphyromonas sp.]
MDNSKASNSSKGGEKKGTRVISRYIILISDVFVSMVAAYLSLVAFSWITGLVRVDKLTTGVILVAALLSTLISSVSLGTYRQLLRYQVFAIGRRMLAMLILNALLFLTFILAGNYLLPLQYSEKALLLMAINYFGFFVVTFVLYRSAAMIVARSLWGTSTSKEARERVVIFGVNTNSSKLATVLQDNPKYRVLGFCAKEPKRNNATVADLPVYCVANNEQLKRLIDRLEVNAIVYSNKSDMLKERDSLIIESAKLGVKSLLSPEINETSPTDLARESVQKIEMEDLLNREVIHHEHDKVKAMYGDKVVMVTGAAGSIGSELVLQIAELGVKQLILFDIAETPLHNIRLKLNSKYPDLDFVPILGDVRSQNRLNAIFNKFRPQIVLHAAAYKHVPLLEENPCEGVMANVQGSKNVADFCLKYEVERMVMVSTDKAVNPTNVLGATKRAAEIYVQALGKAVEEGKVEGKTTFITTRFGNVLGSQGSVIPLFRDQIAKGGPVTVTDPRINRFFMSIHEACSLILEASSVATATTIFVFDMGKPHKIKDLAENMIRLAGLEPYTDIDIKFTGLRPGEKLYEEKLADGENTIPTKIPKIHIAKVRDHEYHSLYDTYEALRDHARKFEIEESVQLLLDLIPEYTPAPNSPFSTLRVTH